MTKTAIFEVLKLKLRAVTPLHIRNNHVLIRDKDFYVRNRVLHRLDYSSLLKSVAREDKNDIFQQIKSKGMASLFARPQKKTSNKRPGVEEDWKKALRAKLGVQETPAEPTEEKEIAREEDNEAIAFIERHHLYSTEMHSRNIANRIQTIITSPNLRPFLPGSTLKGALRTALYAHAILERPSRLERLRFTWTADPVEADYPLHREMSGFDIHDIGKDIFRDLIVGDSNTVACEDSMGVFQIKVLNIRRNADGDMTVVWKAGNRRNTPILREADTFFWEMICPQTQFHSEITILRDRRSSSLIHLDTASLLQACNNFSRWIVDRELEYAQEHKIVFLENFYRQLQEQCEDASESGNCAYLPVGSGLPWHAKTVGGLLDDASLEAIRRHFYRYMGKFVYTPSGAVIHGMRLKRGRCPKSGKLIRPDKLECLEPFPKTRHVVFDGSQPSEPPGWLYLEVTD